MELENSSCGTLFTTNLPLNLKNKSEGKGISYAHKKEVKPGQTVRKLNWGQLVKEIDRNYEIDRAFTFRTELNFMKQEKPCEDIDHDENGRWMRTYHKLTN